MPVYLWVQARNRGPLPSHGINAGATTLIDKQRQTQIPGLPVTLGRGNPSRHASFTPSTKFTGTRAGTPRGWVQYA
ncbi:MAG TPA: hypothetical protein VMV99_06440 [Rhodanobacter sp.]|nr:hypothetical protein [Rhodanobacter sp.]